MTTENQYPSSCFWIPHLYCLTVNIKAWWSLFTYPAVHNCHSDSSDAWSWICFCGCSPSYHFHFTTIVNWLMTPSILNLYWLWSQKGPPPPTLAYIGFDGLSLWDRCDSIRLQMLQLLWVAGHSIWQGQMECLSSVIYWRWCLWASFMYFISQLQAIRSYIRGDHKLMIPWF